MVRVQLLCQIEQSTGRIAELVKAVKSYSYMDQSPMQEVDIHEGIEDSKRRLRVGRPAKHISAKHKGHNLNIRVPKSSSLHLSPLAHWSLKAG